MASKINTIGFEPVRGNELYRRFSPSPPFPVYIHLYFHEPWLRAEPGTSLIREEARFHPDRSGHSHASWPIPPLRAAAANALLTQIAPLAARMCAGLKGGWAGSLTSLNADAQRAFEEIKTLCDNVGEDEALRVMPASEFMFRYGTRAEQRVLLGISLLDHYLDLKRVAEKIEYYALKSHDIDVLDGLQDYIEGLWKDLLRDLAKDVRDLSGSEASLRALEDYVQTQVLHGEMDPAVLAKGAPMGPSST